MPLEFHIGSLLNGVIYAVLGVVVLIVVLTVTNGVLEKLTPTTAEVSYPDSGAGRGTLSIDALKEGFAGLHLIAKHIEVVSPHLDRGFDDTPRHWILGPVRAQWPVYRDVLLASLLAACEVLGATSSWTLRALDSAPALLGRDPPPSRARLGAGPPHGSRL